MSYAQQALGRKGMPSSERSILLAYLTQSIWTLSRLSEAGYETPTQCICGAPKDDLRLGSWNVLRQPRFERSIWIPRTWTL
eukprot:4215936-Pyramimonas_sp.AAC.1